MTSQTTAKPRAGRPGPLSETELRKLDALWRASNYLSLGQIYLLDNPLLRKPLARGSTSSRGCSDTGAPRRVSTSSTCT